MIIAGLIVLLALLFFLLSRAADLVIFNIRKLGETLRIRVFTLGMILGVFTSLPETALGITAVVHNVGAISFGNLVGGTLVLFGLILGLSAILNRTIKTDGNPAHILTVSLYSLLPLVLGLDGIISIFDAAICIVSYFLLFHYLAYVHRHTPTTGPVFHWLNDRKNVKQLFMLVIGVVAVVVISNIIMKFTLDLLEYVRIPQLLVGLIIFSLGTNLPELIVTIRSWRQHIRDLSLGNLIGSAIVNPLIIGLLSLLQPLVVSVDANYMITFLFMMLIGGSVGAFYITHKQLSRVEGFMLILLYVVFIVSQMIVLVVKT